MVGLEPDPDDIQKLVDLITTAHHCVAFTGAGISTLSGIQDFRGKNGLYKTINADITFFGEMLPREALEAADRHSRKADLMLILGTSLIVYPAASLPEKTLRNGGTLVIVNDMPTPLDEYAALKFSDLHTTFEALEKALPEIG